MVVQVAKPYTVELLRNFDRVPLDHTRLSVANEYLSPWLRHGVQNIKAPAKTADEQLREPRVSLGSLVPPIPPEVLAMGAELVQGKKFTPEYILNLIGMSEASGRLEVRANHINYGVLPVLRDLTGIFTEQVMHPVLDHFAPIAVRGVLTSPRHGVMYLARRANVSVSGAIDTYPAGVVEEGKTLVAALGAEASEEAGLTLGSSTTALLIGVSRGRTEAPNPNFNYMMETNWSLQRLTETSMSEHDRVYEVRLDEKVLQRFILEELILPQKEHARITDAGLGAMLQFGRAYFGSAWYAETIEMLQKAHSLPEQSYPKITVIDRSNANS